MSGAQPAQPSPLPKLIAVAVVLVALCAGGGIVAVKLPTTLRTPLAGGIYQNSKAEAKEYKDDDLYTAFIDDSEMAMQHYGERWVIVSGECNEPVAFRPDNSALNEEVYLEIGKRTTQFNVEWKVRCKVPSAQARAFQQLQEGTKVKVLGYCKGMKDRQVVLEDCELKWKGLAP
jgi:hypothetical protein